MLKKRGPTIFFALVNVHKTAYLPDQTKSPYKIVGLAGEKYVSAKANYSKLEEKLFEVYPKISDGGGFQILRAGPGGHSSSLSVISPPPNGYSVPFLRDESGLGQALAYIRPLQLDLDTIVHTVVSQ